MAAPSSCKKRPKLIVFDLDYTLWPFWIDTHVNPPFRKKGPDVVDASGHKVKFYPDVPEILAALHSQGFKLAVASRTACTEEANQLLKLFGWDQYFTYKEIYPGCKRTHFHKFRKQSGINFEDMLFFDDEYRNVQDLQTLGVTCMLVSKGVTHLVLREGLAKFAEKSPAE